LNKPFTAAQLISLLNELLTLHLEARSELNFSSLTAFAGEDPEASASILKTFSEETRKSIDLLRDALEGKDREEASRISHKLIPLFTMLGANSLVQHLRILEKNDEELTDSGWYHLLGEVIEQALAIVKDAESAIG
jgi:HPt (histidine-containing phosphotransfer) domain-containing protein